MSDFLHNRKLELTILFLMVCYTLVMLLPGVSNQLWYQFLLLPALVFPGLTHGAADHHLELKDYQVSKFSYFLRYVAIMLLILILWIVSPTLGLLIFLFLSAWHFGETDLRDWGIFKPWRALLFGSGLLGFLLFSHSTEAGNLIASLRVEAFGDFISQMTIPGSLISLCFCLIPLASLPSEKLGLYAVLMLMLLLGALLPLVSAFLWYFCAWHSIRGWVHIRLLTGYTNSSLLKVASPFAFGAIIVFLTMVVFRNYFLSANAEAYSIFFVFIASLSTPHIINMSLSYRRHKIDYVNVKQSVFC